MKSAIVFCLLSVAAIALARPEEKYDSRFDNVNLDEILGNHRLLTPYVQCALDKGKCTPDAKELKDHIQEALENNCAKCTDAQKDGTRRVIKHLINNEQEFWNELVAKYDPKKEFSTKYETELREIKA